MFCGFPVSVATLPTVAAVARASRYGTEGSASCRVISSTTGARTRHTTSFTKNADRTPEAATTAARRASGVRARRSVHGGHGIRPGQRARDDHQRGADDRDARAVDTEGGHAAEPEPDVGGDERGDRDRATPLAAGHRSSIHAGV